MDQEAKCPICSKPANLVGAYRGGNFGFDCRKCGKFEIGNVAATELGSWTTQQLINLSGWVRENPNSVILASNLSQLTNLKDLSVGEKAEKILLQLAHRFPAPGAWLDFSKGAHLEFLSIGRAADDQELKFLLREYLSEETGFLISHTLTTSLGNDDSYKISPKGWAYIDSFRRRNSNSEVGFIAMWFDASMKNASVAIENGVRDAGYRPFRVDQKEHNNDITDEIIAGIRGSKFLIADLTSHRNGVYYEAGFAKGLGLEVVWLCRESDKKERHFDIEHLNCIFWTEDKLPELSKALKNRVLASSIGPGPLPRADS